MTTPTTYTTTNDSALGVLLLPAVRESEPAVASGIGEAEGLSCQLGRGLVAGACRPSAGVEVHLALLVCLQLGNMALGLGGGSDDLGSSLLDCLLDGVDVLVAIAFAASIDVAHVHDGLARQRRELLVELLLGLGQLDLVHVVVFHQDVLVSLQHLDHLFCVGGLLEMVGLSTARVRRSMVSRALGWRWSWLTSLSLTGAALPSTCVLLSPVRRRRTRVTVLSERMLGRSVSPSPAPLLAHVPRAAVSAIPTFVGKICAGRTIKSAARRYRCGRTAGWSSPARRRDAARASAAHVRTGL